MIETILVGILKVAGGLLLASFIGVAIYVTVGFFLVKKAMKEAPKALENINKALDEVHKELDNKDLLWEDVLSNIVEQRKMNDS